MNQSLQDVYRDAHQGVRASFGDDLEGALDYYTPLVRFVSGVCPPSDAAPTRLLDVGCGVGWSTFAFGSHGYDATGIDLNPAAFEPPPHERCTLREGSATEIPFPADSFEAVVCYQCLEHVPEPALALDEMARVCRPGGVVAVVGPNLVSPLLGVILALRPSAWKSIRFRRRPGMARHPYGNTISEVFAVGLLRGAQLAAKLARRSPHFSMREPDGNLPFQADNDACYLCNPTDLIAHFRGRGLRIERRGKPGRPPLAYLLAGGTWVAARKPDPTPARPVAPPPVPLRQGPPPRPRPDAAPVSPAGSRRGEAPPPSRHA